jgi:hypothetical protein
MRSLVSALIPVALLAFSAASFAQQPPRLEPLPEPPPLPPGVVTEAAGDQSVRISPGQTDQVEELLRDGKRTIKVTQPDGRVYYIQEQTEPGESTVADGLSPRLRAPRWVVIEF